MRESDWLCLMIGNSRLHWAYFKRELLISVWDTEHFNSEVALSKVVGNRGTFHNEIPLYIASVVPAQTVLWSSYPHAKVIKLDDIPLKNIYPTMGIDRALALWGAVNTWDNACLVIDGGTALTFSAADEKKQFFGGAILPGLKLQFSSLVSKTAALPDVTLPEKFPPIRWADNTSEAISSGVIYTILGGIKEYITDWWDKFPSGQIFLTGGDAIVLMSYLQLVYPAIAEKITVEPYLIFLGMKAILI